MNRGLVKTELICPDLWGDEPFYLELPPMYFDDQIHLSFTVPWYGDIEGLFEVEDILHMYDGETGYTQRLKIAPLD